MFKISRLGVYISTQVICYLFQHSISVCVVFNLPSSNTWFGYLYHQRCTEVSVKCINESLSMWLVNMVTRFNHRSAYKIYFPNAVTVNILRRFTLVDVVLRYYTNRFRGRWLVALVTASIRWPALISGLCCMSFVCPCWWNRMCQYEFIAKLSNLFVVFNCRLAICRAGHFYFFQHASHRT